MKPVPIGSRSVGPGAPVYIVAEMSANHHHSIAEARDILHAIKEAGADAVKLQTYTADTITLDASGKVFQIGAGSLWSGRTLHALYREAFTPWEWHAELRDLAARLGLDFFSSPFDVTAVDFLEELGVPVYKIASFELVDIPLIEKVASTGKPLILSTGMGTLEEITEAVQAFRRAGGRNLILLKCTSAYPAPPEAMNLRSLAALRENFDVPVGLSDHTLASESAVAAVALGACLVEKHFTLDRSKGGPDAAFSLEPKEFAGLVRAIRTTEAALGRAIFQPTAEEQANLRFRKSLFASAPIKKGEPFTAHNVRCVRPGDGLHPRHYREILGRTAACDIPAMLPLAWSHVA